MLLKVEVVANRHIDIIYACRFEALSPRAKIYMRHLKPATVMMKSCSYIDRVQVHVVIDDGVKVSNLFSLKMLRETVFSWLTSSFKIKAIFAQNGVLARTALWTFFEIKFSRRYYNPFIYYLCLSIRLPELAL